MNNTSFFLIAALLGALVGGSAVYVFIGGGSDPGSSAASPSIAELQAASAARAREAARAAEAARRKAQRAAIPPSDVAERESAEATARRVAAAREPQSDAARRLFDAPSWADEVSRKAEVNRPPEDEVKRLNPETVQFINDRTRGSVMSFVDAAQVAVEVAGTPDEALVAKAMADRLRNAMYYAPEQIKPEMNALHEATKALAAGEENAEYEWNEARKDLFSALDNLPQ